MANIKRVLIPTDFSVGSLRIVLEFLEQSNPEEPLELVLAGGLHLGDSITTLLGFSKEDYLSELQNEDFIKGCEIIRSRFEDHVVELYSDVLSSKNSRYLQNYMKGHQIQELIYLEQYRFELPHKNSFDLNAVLKALDNKLYPKPQRLCMPMLKSTHIDSMDSIFFRKDWNLSYE